MLNRLVRLINVSIAILVLLIAVAVYWYALRPLPQVSGEMTAPIQNVASIRRDQRGVPHIEAGNWQDAVFLQGFATAQDRLWQMDTLRRFGSGELAAVFGPAALEQDKRSRSMRLRELAEAAAERLSPEDRAVFVEYARGVNYEMEMERGKLPLEFTLPGHVYDPRPWTVSDSIVVGLVMYRQMTDTLGSDLQRGILLSAAKDSARFRTLFPALQGGQVNPGSNAWAVSGTHSESGKPLLANDTHLEYGIPPTWHLVHMKAPGLNVSGCALPGVPGVIIGHNENIAWGVTNLQNDVMDLYSEQLDPNTGRYVYQGHIEQAQLDREVIGVRGGKPTLMNIWVTRHGPVVASQGNHALTMHWSANDGFGFPFWDIDKAQNWNQFRAAVGRFWGPPQNFVYADNAGNIGYQAGGRIPIRHGFDSDVPLDGASGKFEWDGYIPYEQMPSVYNPPSGIIATSNQNPYPPNYPFEIEGSFADPYRVEQVKARLSSKPKLDVPFLLTVQKDVYSAYDEFLARVVVAAWAAHPGQDRFMQEAVGVLQQWDGQMDKDEAAPMVTQLLSAELSASLMKTLQAPPAASAGLLPRPYTIQKLLEGKPHGWVPNDDWDEWMLTNLGHALQVGRKVQGSPVKNWRWGRILQWKIAHPVGKQLPFVDAYFDIGPVPMSGSGTTVKQTTQTLGPSERLVVDLGDLERSEVNLTTGESGHVASPHYKDEWPAYYVGNSFPMEFQYVDAKESLHVHPEMPAK